jgi:hypothetical protein
VTTTHRRYRGRSSGVIGYCSSAVVVAQFPALLIEAIHAIIVIITAAAFTCRGGSRLFASLSSYFLPRA